MMGMDEKRAYTLVLSISASGELLLMQTIFFGQTISSCSSKGARRYSEVENLGFKFEPSWLHTDWSTQATMQLLINDIIAPYFNCQKEKLGLPSTQCSLWMIDCWSVYKSNKFLSWMKDAHPNIIVLFIPGNCTGVWQPLDIGIQRVLKQSMKCSAHKDIVEETMALSGECVCQKTVE
jgi:hypothetical protein